MADQPGVLSRGWITFLSKLPRVAKALSKLQVLVYRLSSGRIASTFQGFPICLVTMAGRSAGREITLPLMYVPHGEAILLVASFGGASRHPAWYRNLVANPTVFIRVNGRRLKMRARQAESAEKALLWPLCVASYPEFSTYQKRTNRDIPVMVCEKLHAEP